MSDYKFLIENRLTAAQLEVLNRLSQAAARAGVNLYLVGGAVRDLTCGRPIRNLDFAVEGKPQEILRQIKKNEFLFFDHDTRRQTAEVVFQNDVRVEIGMSRRETYSRVGGAPTVTPAVIFEDLRRRDFSINAMAVSLNPNSSGLFLDPTNGIADMDRRELRALDNRSFWNDPVRIFRFYRLGVRLGFQGEPRTETWLERALEDRTTSNLNTAQQGKELRETLREDNPGQVLSHLADKGILSDLDPTLPRVRTLADEFKSIRKIAQTIPQVPPFLLNFYGLTRKLNPARRRRFAQKILNIPGERKLGLSLEAEAKKIAKAMGGRKRLPSQGYDLLSSKPPLLLLFLLIYSKKASLKKEVKNFLFKVPTLRAQLPYAELEAAGMPPGPMFEDAMERIFRELLDKKVRTPNQTAKLILSLVEEAKAPPEGKKKKKKKKKR